MNKRIRKKMEKPIIDICKVIKADFWNDVFYWYWGIPNRKDYDFKDEYDVEDYKFEYQKVLFNREMLYKIVKKAYKDNFKIDEYKIYEIPYSDKDGCVVYFINESDKKKNKDKWRAIAFWVESRKNGVAIPHKDINSTLYPRNTCQEAVYLMD